MQHQTQTYELGVGLFTNCSFPCFSSLPIVIAVGVNVEQLKVIKSITLMYSYVLISSTIGSS